MGLKPLSITVIDQFPVAFFIEFFEKNSVHTVSATLEDCDKFQISLWFPEQHHSTEMTPLKVTNDLLMAADDVMFRVLVLLDLSAAFVGANDHMSSFAPVRCAPGVGSGTSFIVFLNASPGAQNTKTWCFVPFLY